MEDYEKKYNSAMEVMRQWIAPCHTQEQLNVLKTSVFPELKESEDERIRKELIEQVIYITPNNDEVDDEGNVLPIYQKRIDKYRAWLEKQGEQKPAKTAKEAWKEMRLEVYSQASGNRHEPNYSDDGTQMFSLNDIDEIFEKIGDFVVEQNQAWSEKGVNGNNEEIPNSEQKQDVSIRINPSEYINDMGGNGCYLKNTTQASAWSEEDERMLKASISFIKSSPHPYSGDTFRGEIGKDEAEKWLNSLKARYTWKPSKEQMEFLWKYAEQNNYDGSILTSLYNDLKKLREK